MKHVLFAVCVIGCLALAGCPSPVSNDENPGGSIYAEECWGEWLRMDKEETWYISGGAIKINGYGRSKSVSLSKQSERVIQVTEGGQKYYLYASRIANTSFTGKVAAFDGASRSVQRSVAAGKGWAKVVIEDLDNGSTKTAQTDGNGNFKVDNIIPGDQYQVTPEGGTPVTVTPKGDGDDVGTITITDGVNFKTSGSQDILSMNRRHDITLSITNVGTEDCLAATYRLDFEGGLLSPVATEGILGTIEPGRTKTIEMPLRYDSLDEPYAGKKIFITITDPISNKTWEDSVSVRFYDSSWDIPFSMHAASSVSGMIISPENQTYRFSGRDVSLSLSWSPDDYLVVFSGASADTETAYSFSVYGSSVDNFDDFKDSGNYEPNNTEQTAAYAPGGGVISYLHKNDIDYYRCKGPDLKDTPVGLSLGESLAWLDKNAQPNGVYRITLNGDETIGPKTLSYGGKSVSITLLGGVTERTVSLSSNGSLFTVESGVSLVLDNNITLRGRSDNTDPLVRVNNGGALVMNAGSKISGNTAASYFGGGVYVYGDGTFTMEGGEISGNTASSGGGVYVRGTFAMSGGEISGNTASSSGGGVYMYGDGTFTMEGGEISGNTASSASGGGVSVGGGTFAMEGGEISGNTASSSGGGVSVGNGTFAMEGGEISGNTASSASGGGVYVVYGTFTMSDGEISGNTASSSGGGVSVGSGTFTKQSGGTIYGSDANAALKNTATNDGHAVYVRDGSKKRNATAGVGVTLDSTKSGTAGGWE